MSKRGVARRWGGPALVLGVASVRERRCAPRGGRHSGDAASPSRSTGRTSAIGKPSNAPSPRTSRKLYSGTSLACPRPSALTSTEAVWYEQLLIDVQIHVSSEIMPSRAGATRWTTWRMPRGVSSAYCDCLLTGLLLPMPCASA